LYSLFKTAHNTNCRRLTLPFTYKQLFSITYASYMGKAIMSRTEYTGFSRTVTSEERSLFEPFGNMGALMNTRDGLVFVKAETLMTQFALVNAALPKTGPAYLETPHHAAIHDAIEGMQAKAASADQENSSAINARWNWMKAQAKQGKFTALPDELRAPKASIPNFLRRKTG